MKTLITTILILFSYFAFSQTPYQIADTTKDWNTMSIGAGSWNIHYCGGTKTNKFKEEIIIDGQNYLKVFESEDSLQENWEEVGAIREDTVNRLVYFDNYMDDPGLIYNFSLTVGDSVSINNYYAGYTSELVCEQIDSVIVNGSYRNRYHFSAVYYNREGVVRNDIIEVWIESIGSLYGVLNSGFGGTGAAGGTKTLLCCSQNDTVIYMDSVYGECYIEQFYPQILQEEYDTAYLDTYYEFQLQIDSMNVDSFAVTGEVIPEDFYFDESTYLLTGNPDTTGSFPCIITATNKAYGFKTDMIYADIVVVLPVEIQEKPEQTDIKIYPNPFGNKLIVSIDNDYLGDYYLAIYNCEGKLIDKKTLRSGFSIIESSHYKTGIYLVKLTDGKQNILIIEKVIKK